MESSISQISHNDPEKAQFCKFLQQLTGQKLASLSQCKLNKIQEKINHYDLSIEYDHVENAINSYRDILNIATKEEKIQHLKKFGMILLLFAYVIAGCLLQYNIFKPNYNDDDEEIPFSNGEKAVFAVFTFIVVIIFLFVIFQMRKLFGCQGNQAVVDEQRTQDVQEQKHTFRQDLAKQFFMNNQRMTQQSLKKAKVSFDLYKDGQNYQKQQQAIIQELQSRANKQIPKKENLDDFLTILFSSLTILLAQVYSMYTITRRQKRFDGKQLQYQDIVLPMCILIGLCILANIATFICYSVKYWPK